MDSEYSQVQVKSLDFSEVRKVVDEGRAIDVVCMDFIKVSYQVPHGMLMQKIKMYGIPCDLVVQIPNWLTPQKTV